MNRRAAAAVVALTLAASTLATAAPAAAATKCGTLRSETRSAISGSYLTVTATTYWRVCTIPSGARYDDPAKFQIGWTWTGDPHCNRIWGGFTGLSWDVTVRDDAPRSYRRAGALPCKKSGVGYAEVSLAGAPRLAQTLNSRWVSTFKAHYRNMPDPGGSVAGDF